MRILIVEDQDTKREHLALYLREIFRDVEIAMARSLQSGLASVIGCHFDLVVLDMTMPAFDTGPDEPGGRLQPFAGREILEQLERRGLLIPTVVVTQFDKFGDDHDPTTLHELDAQMMAEHAKLYRGTVYYNAAVNGWKTALLEKVSDLVQSSGDGM